MFDQFSSDFDKNSLEPNSLNFALNQVQLKLQTFFATSTASEQLNQVFDVTDQNASNFLIANGKNGIFDIPQLQILPDIAMNGAQAAFSLAKDTIYLADSLVGGSTLDIEKVIIEELGHKFDTLLNPGGDTPGDEGELFKDIVLGLPLSQPELLRIQTENDFGTVVVDNQVISVEQAHKNSTDATGDGKGDAIVVNNDGVYVRRSNGSKFLPNEKWIDIPFWGSIGTGFSDVTGDGKADAIASNNDGVYIRRSDGNKFLPNEKWTDIGFLGSKAAGFGDVTGDGKADAIVSNNDGVYVRRSNGSKFLPNEKWTDIGYWGSKGTWFGDVALTGTSSTPPPPPGYYRELSSLSETQWDQQSGDNNQFEQYPLGGGGDQRGKTDDRIEQIYTDLSNTIFGSRVPMTSGYAYDQSYYSGYGTWHAGLDMGASYGVTIKSVIGGTVAWTSGSGDGNIFVGINSDDGRQWVYGHLKSASGLSNGKRINTGETVGIVGWYNGAPHLHLEVENGKAYGGTQGAMKNQGTLLNVTVSPLMAYWQWRNR